MWCCGTWPRRSALWTPPLPVTEGTVVSVAFSPDGKTLAAGYYAVLASSGGVVLWDVAERKRLAEGPLAVITGRVYSMAFSPDGTTLAAGFGGGDRGVELWDVAERNRLGQGSRHSPGTGTTSWAWTSVPTARALPRDMATSSAAGVAPQRRCGAAGPRSRILEVYGGRDRQPQLHPRRMASVLP